MVNDIFFTEFWWIKANKRDYLLLSNNTWKKADFAEVSKNLARYRFENNFIKPPK